MTLVVKAAPKERNSVAQGKAPRRSSRRSGALGWAMPSRNQSPRKGKTEAPKGRNLAVVPTLRPFGATMLQT